MTCSKIAQPWSLCSDQWQSVVWNENENANGNANDSEGEAPDNWTPAVQRASHPPQIRLEHEEVKKGTWKYWSTGR